MIERFSFFLLQSFSHLLIQGIIRLFTEVYC
jgi:hypothetical protein